MKSMLQWFLLCGVFTIYLLLGGAVFMVLERSVELSHKGQLRDLGQDVQDVLLRMDHEHLKNGSTLEALRTAKQKIIQKISIVCEEPRLWNNSIPDTLKWDFYNSIMYGFTIVTTIGYGHLTPKSNWSRLFAILFGLIGIPINGILLKNLGDFFGKRMMTVYERSKNDKLLMTFQITMYLLPGVIVFILLPAGLFTYVEKWSFIESFYFSCISLMTIGFGDYVPGKSNGNSAWLWIYKTFIIVWIQFGLGYVFMILSFITKGLKHKKIRRALRQRTTTMNSAREQLLMDLEDMRRVIKDPHHTVPDSVSNEPFYSPKGHSIHSFRPRVSMARDALSCQGQVEPLRKRRRTLTDNDSLDESFGESGQRQNTMSGEQGEQFLAAMTRVVHDVLVAVDEISEFRGRSHSPARTVSGGISGSQVTHDQADDGSTGLLRMLNTVIKNMSTGSRGRGHHRNFSEQSRNESESDIYWGHPRERRRNQRRMRAVSSMATVTPQNDLPIVTFRKTSEGSLLPWFSRTNGQEGRETSEEVNKSNPFSIQGSSLTRRVRGHSPNSYDDSFQSKRDDVNRHKF